MKKILKHPITIKFLFTTELVVFLFSAVMLPLLAFAQTPTFAEYPVATDTAYPCGIAKGPDNNIWFGQQGRNRDKIGKMTPDGVLTEYTVPTLEAGMCHVTAGPDGNMWFTESFTQKIVKVTMSGAITEYPLPRSTYMLPSDLVFDNSGKLWVTAYSSNKIVVLNTQGAILASYNVAGNGPEGISLGPDGNLWFAIQNTDQVARINSSTGAITYYGVADAPMDTIAGPDGNIWFTSYSGQVGRLNPSNGAINYYSVTGVGGWGPSFLAIGPDNNVWFNKSGYGLGKIIPSTGAITYYASPYGSMGGAFDLTAGPDNKMWFTVNNNRSRIVKLDIGLPNPLPVNTPSGSTSSSGSGSSSGSSSSSGNTNTAKLDESVSSPGTPAESRSKTKTTVLIMQNGETKSVVETGIDPEKKDISIAKGEVLVVDGALGRVDVRNGASIKGTGKIGKLTVENGGVLAPGHSPGCLATKDFVLNGTYKADVGGTNACSNLDKVTVSGSVALSGDLDVDLWKKFTPKSKQEFVIIDNDGKDTVVGQFANLPEGFAFLVDGSPFTVSYIAGDGNDVAIKALPPSASLMALLGQRNGENTPHIKTLYETFASYRTPMIIAELAVLVVVLGSDIFIFKVVRSGRDLGDVLGESFIHIIHPTHKV